MYLSFISYIFQIHLFLILFFSRQYWFHLHVPTSHFQVTLKKCFLYSNHPKVLLGLKQTHVYCTFTRSHAIVLTQNINFDEIFFKEVEEMSWRHYSLKKTDRDLEKYRRVSLKFIHVCIISDIIYVSLWYKCILYKDE